jgi:hypothetical protein
MVWLCIKLLLFLSKKGPLSIKPKKAVPLANLCRYDRLANGTAFSVLCLGVFFNLISK